MELRERIRGVQSFSKLLPFCVSARLANSRRNFLPTVIRMENELKKVDFFGLYCV